MPLRQDSRSAKCQLDHRRGERRRAVGAPSPWGRGILRAMEARELALWHARGRQLVGAAFLLAPGLAGSAWIGSDARRRPVKVLARAFGARDLAIGLGVVIALDRGTPVRGWIEAGALSDAVDTCASLLAGGSIHPAIRWPAIAFGATSTAAGAELANQFDHTTEPIPGQTPEAALTGHPPETE